MDLEPTTSLHLMTYFDVAEVWVNRKPSYHARIFALPRRLSMTLALVHYSFACPIFLLVA